MGRRAMGIEFSADEIFEMAEQIERNGAQFYHHAAEGMKESSGRKVLIDLALMEEQHEKTFAAMRARLSKEERAPTVFDPEGQVALYLRSVADGHVFDVRTDPMELLSGEEEFVDILRIAIELEKDSIVFYLGMKDLVPKRLGGGWVDEIINEEMRHIGILSQQLTSQGE
jgi:rubrerythrin